MALAPGTRLGAYEIVSPLGAGGMGEVYCAKDPELDREVAIKVLPDRLALDSEATQRFKREAKTLAALSHPHILTVFAFGSDGEVGYAVSELLDGETLRERLKRERRLPWRAALEIALEIADGLAAAHTKGIVHRDIKPTNLFVTSNEVVKVLDFGLAKSVSAPSIASTEETAPTLARENGATEAGVVMGTLGYMSPEQAKGPRPHRRVTASRSVVCSTRSSRARRRSRGGRTRKRSPRSCAMIPLRSNPKSRISRRGCSGS